MKRFFSGLKNEPLQTLNAWQDSRWPWGIIACAMVVMVLIAHDVFQGWLHMLPCEQCVYIRFGNLVMALGCLMAMINPKALVTKIAGYAVTLYGLVYTFGCALTLMRIHRAMHSNDPDAIFGMQGCSLEPHYPFGLPLDKWAPGWFAPTGDCGYDAPVVPDGAVLGELQRWLIEWYRSYEGWYLIPQWRFLNMAECCFLACCVAAVMLAAMLVGWLGTLAKSRAR